MGNLVMFSEQKMFRWKEDIRVYADESKMREVLSIKARQIMDFYAAYDVVDTEMNQKVGALRRKGWRSMVRDEWEVLACNSLYCAASSSARGCLKITISPLVQRASPTSNKTSISSATN